MKKWGLYEWSVVLFFLFVPSVATLIEQLLFNYSSMFINVAFKWVVFSGIGLRLGSSGVKQIAHPQFTAREIFNIKDDNASSVIRELGFANICFATLAISSLFVPLFRLPAAIAGGTYFGLAGLLHLFKNKDSEKEIFAMVSDLFIFLILLILAILNIM